MILIVLGSWLAGVLTATIILLWEEIRAGIAGLWWTAYSGGEP